jgi:hypothetical protein
MRAVRRRRATARDLWTEAPKVCGHLAGMARGLSQPFVAVWGIAAGITPVRSGLGAGCFRRGVGCRCG